MKKEKGGGGGGGGIGVEGSEGGGKGRRGQEREQGGILPKYKSFFCRFVFLGEFIFRIQIVISIFPPAALTMSWFLTLKLFA